MNPLASVNLGGIIMNKKCLYTVLLMFIIILITTACNNKQNDQKQEVVFPPEIKENVIKVKKDTAKGFHWPYFLYIPDNIKYDPTPVIVIANNTPQPDDNYSVHYNQARSKIIQYKHFSEETGIPLLLCALPRFKNEMPGAEALQQDAWLISVQSLTRNAMLTNVETLKRIDLQVIAMIEDAGEKLRNKGIKNTGKAIMFGFSSSGSFANRFTILHPELVEMEIAGAPGGWYTLPLASYKGTSLRYQVGIADIEEIAGRSFNKESFSKIPKFFFVGSEDKDDAVPYLDSYTYEDRITIMELFGKDHLKRYKTIEKIFKENKINHRFKFYKDTGHEISDKAWRDIFNFVEENL